MCSDEMDSREQPLTSTEIEAYLSDDFQKNKPVISLEQPFSTTSLFIPKTNGSGECTITMTDWYQPDKALLYKALIAVYNYVFFNKEAPISAKVTFVSAARPFIEWLNAYTVGNRYEILKRYESERMDALGNHGGSSPLNKLKTVLTCAIESEAFRVEVGSDGCQFLMELRKTKISPNVNKTQKSLASYFGELDWLRRDDIGIGKKLYSVLASPKLTVNSLSLTAATVILELNKYQSVLKFLVQKAQPKLSQYLEIDFLSSSIEKRSKYIGYILYHIISTFHQNDDNPPHAKAALDMMLLSNAKNERAHLLMLDALVSQDACDALFLNQINFKNNVSTAFCYKNITSIYNGSLFSLDILLSLSRDHEHVITGVENMMFGWLMASLAVQPYDIPKLTPESFRKMRMGGRVTQIECEYFKGRAKVFYTTRSLSVREAEGQALLAYLNASVKGALLYTQVEQVISNGMHSLTGTVRLLFESDAIKIALRVAHSKKKAPFILPSVYCALIKNGLHSENVIKNPIKFSIKERTELVRQSKSPCRISLFGLQAIKNSAVHAFSDPYTYHYLINHNSHSNQTEKVNYLTEDNEEWMNRSGRITREVMFDLIQNVFALGFNKEQSKVVEVFNSEFMAVSEGISYKSEEMNARLRLVTGQVQGRVNEVGVLAISNKTDDEELYPIYVLDCPLTVLKMQNYLHEFLKNYKKLLATNPDFLFRTVMPTVEWMESTLSKMSKKSQQLGREQFDEMIKKGVVMSVFHSL